MTMPYRESFKPVSRSEFNTAFFAAVLGFFVAGMGVGILVACHYPRRLVTVDRVIEHERTIIRETTLPIVRCRGTLDVYSNSRRVQTARCADRPVPNLHLRTHDVMVPNPREPDTLTGAWEANENTTDQDLPEWAR